jgi:MarR family transcriptional regulator, organic hydroperoxide resistance regulator
MSVRRFFWAMRSVYAQLDRLDNVWAVKLGISGPQWLIMAALTEVGGGVPVNKLAKTLGVDPSFITTQTKTLENRGLLVRKPSPEDARVVLISPTARFRKSWDELSLRRSKLHTIVFSDLSPPEIDRVIGVLSQIELSLEKAARLVELDADQSIGEDLGRTRAP